MILGSKVRVGAAKENPNLTSGSQSAVKDVKVMNLSVVTPLDHLTAMQSLKDNKGLFYMILSRFRKQNLLPSIK
jgi:hypothetical protein